LFCARNKGIPGTVYIINRAMNHRVLIGILSPDFRRLEIKYTVPGFPSVYLVGTLSF
jgi:hypothetical protein